MEIADSTRAPATISPEGEIGEFITAGPQFPLTSCILLSMGAALIGENPLDLGSDVEAFLNQRGGHQFEKKVCAELLSGLDSSCYVGWSSSIRLKNKPDAANREIDFVVVGPNGVFLIEAKNWRKVTGDFLGRWTYFSSAGAQQPATKDVWLKYQSLLPAATPAVYKALGIGGARKLFNAVRMYCVFPANAIIDLRDEDGTPVRHSGRMHVVTLDRLSKEIQSIAHPHDDNRVPRVLNKNQCRDIITNGFYFKARNRANDIVGGHWRIVGGRIGGPVQAANGLTFFEYKLQHVEEDPALKEDDKTFRRGKQYDLSDPERLSEYRHLVERHRKVGESLLNQPHISPCLEHFGDEQRAGYWVLEQWREGSSLQASLGQPWPHARMRHVMTQIAEGIQGIHRQSYYRRHLMPRSVFMTNSGDIYLTDFETVKIEGKPTVVNTTRYQHDPYIAPEVERNPNVVTAQADIYNWAAIFYELAAGKAYEGEFNPRGNPAALEKAGLPPAIFNLLRACLQGLPELRPPDMAAVLKVLNAWQE